MTKELRRPHILDALIVVLLVLFVTPQWTYAEYPRISALNSRDVVYKQHQSGVEEYHRSSRTGGDLPELALYSYKPKDGETLITIASKLMVPYGSIASLNRIANTEIPKDRDTILVPNVPGIFLPESPRTELEYLMWEERKDEVSGARRISVTMNGERQHFHFFPGSDFDQIERRAFLRLLFERPVRDAVISSHYGFRDSPVTGRPQFHGGVDFPANAGTNIVAARGGRVSGTGVDPLYGNYIRIEHDGGFETFYGHLGDVTVRLNDRVSSGMIIGSVGNSGRSTGPHLHFEIRQYGKRRDPVHHLPGLAR